MKKKCQKIGKEDDVTGSPALILMNKKRKQKSNPKMKEEQISKLNIEMS